MSILVNKDTRVICQGITGRVGEFHTQGCLEYGTKIVAGVTPGRGGARVSRVPVFDSVAEAITETGATASVMYVPSRAAADAALEAIGQWIQEIGDRHAGHEGKQNVAEQGQDATEHDRRGDPKQGLAARRHGKFSRSAPDRNSTCP